MIADCETCDRKQVPCKSCQVSQRAICYRCDGDVDDPYCELDKVSVPAWIDAAALQAAREIVALSERWAPARRKAAIQVIIAREMMAAIEETRA